MKSLSLSTVAIALTLALTGCHSDDLTSESIPSIPLEPSIPTTPEPVEIQYGKIIDKWTYPMVLTAEEREKDIYQAVLEKRHDAGRSAQASMVRDQPITCGRPMCWSVMMLARYITRI